MWITCSWCHTGVNSNPDRATFCPDCGHRADAPRMDCDCRVCQRRRMLSELITAVEQDGLWNETLRKYADMLRPSASEEA